MSRILVAIHIDFLKKKKQSSLFPFETRSARGLFDKLPKRYNTYRKKVGVIAKVGEMKDFHSFRHTVRTKLSELDVSEVVIDMTVGHLSPMRSVGSTDYDHFKYMEKKSSAIQQIKYGIDFSKIKKWNETKFKRLELDTLK